MPSSFRHTLRSLSADGFRGTLLRMLAAALLLAGWGAWFLTARVPVYKRSEHARLELVDRVTSVSSTVAGRVVAVHAELGQAVEAGAVLVQLDTGELELELAELELAGAVHASQREALDRQIEVEGRALERFRASAEARLPEERARLAAAEAAAAALEDEVSRLERLHAGGAVPELQLVQTRARAADARAAAEAVRLGAVRIERELEVEEEDRRAEIEELRVERRRLEGEEAVARAAAERVQSGLVNRSLRAPRAGVVAERVTVELGSAVAAGREIVRLAHPGPVQVTARFPVADALGHLRPGQAARIRLAGFSWSEYGSLEATVRRVGGEERDGALHVELELAADAASRIPVQHGLTASVAVEVERVSPAALVLRAAGKLVDREPPPDR